MRFIRFSKVLLTRLSQIAFITPEANFSGAMATKPIVYVTRGGLPNSVIVALGER